MAIPVPIPDFENYTIDECGNVTNTVTGYVLKLERSDDLSQSQS